MCAYFSYMFRHFDFLGTQTQFLTSIFLGKHDLSIFSMFYIRAIELFISTFHVSTLLCCVLILYLNIILFLNLILSRRISPQFLSFTLSIQYETVLRIHDILGWIRILGSMPLTNGSGSGSWIRILLYSSLTFKMSAKN
jgi:hypothetical protein